MTIRPEDFSRFRCPACLQPVTLTADRQWLECSQCERLFPIKDEIPQMMLEEARPKAEVYPS
ncbi:MAG: Trm112 family protein [Blastocatellia bacterium]|nr:Trm112 family protein [Blastocatellia bacterium]